MGYARCPLDGLGDGVNWTFYAPLGLSLAISLLLTILLNVFLRR